MPHGLMPCGRPPSQFSSVRSRGHGGEPRPLVAHKWQARGQSRTMERTSSSARANLCCARRRHRIHNAAEVAAMEETSSEAADRSLHQKAAAMVASSMETYRSKPLSFWLLLVLSAGAMLTAFPASSLLSRLYYNNGGAELWILLWSAVAGWPLPALLLLPCYLASKAPPTPLSPKLCAWYALLGLLSAADNLMYAWAYAYLPASTASLVAASSLAFLGLFGCAIVKNRLGLSTLNAAVVTRRRRRRSVSPAAADP